MNNEYQGNYFEILHPFNPGVLHRSLSTNLNSSISRSKKLHFLTIPHLKSFKCTFSPCSKYE